MTRRLRAVVRTFKRRPILFAVIGIVVAQLIFTAGIRGYVVPHLLPASNWRSGVQHLSDSQLFYEHSIQLAAQARAEGVTVLFDSADERMRHAQILATVFYLVSSDSAWWVYLLNACLAGLSTWLLIRIGLACGLSVGRSAVLGAILGLSPQFLFLHSELLREPFIIPAIQLTWLGCLLFVGVTSEASARPLLRWAPAAIASLAGGFILSCTFRPYLMMPLLASLTLVFVVSLAWRLATQLKTPASWLDRQAAFAATLVVLIVGGVVPESQRAQTYAQGPAETQPADPSRLARLSSPEASAPPAASNAVITAEDLRPSQGCTVHWRTSTLLPAQVDRLFESLACARESFQRYCDPKWYGTRIDRNCDETPVSSFGDTIRHLPSATVFGLLVPYPNMWLNTFGASGTGLRRVGYVIDGIVSYLLLPGLIGLFLKPRQNPRPWPLVFAAAGIVAAIAAYAFGVPSQFILSRFRIGLYRPLLVLGAVGWFRLLRR
jgi:hypothetical protein